MRTHDLHLAVVRIGRNRRIPSHHPDTPPTRHPWPDRPSCDCRWHPVLPSRCCVPGTSPDHWRPGRVDRVRSLEWCLRQNCCTSATHPACCKPRPVQLSIPACHIVLGVFVGSVLRDVGTLRRSPSQYGQVIVPTHGWIAYMHADFAGHAVQKRSVAQAQGPRLNVRRHLSAT